jgi:hypothetical protein
MVVFTYTQTDTILGKLTNGRKIVLTTVTVTNGGLDLTTITVKPLTRIIKWVFGLRHPHDVDFDTADGATYANTVSINPTADATGCVLEILSVGE